MSMGASLISLVDPKQRLTGLKTAKNNRESCRLARIQGNVPPGKSCDNII